jgi:hypothetical protein
MIYEPPKAIDLNGPMVQGFEENQAGCNVGVAPDKNTCAVGSGHVSVQCCDQGAHAGRICISGSTQEW